MSKRNSRSSAKPVSANFTIVSDVQVVDIAWERLFLNFAVKSFRDEDLSFSIKRISIGKLETIDYDTFDQDRSNLPALIRESIPLVPQKKIDNVYYFRINLAIVSDGNFPDNGRWYLTVAGPDDSQVLLCSVSSEEAYKLRDLDRIFPYKKHKYSYTVQFRPTSIGSENLVAVMHSRFMIRNSYWKDSLAIRERKTIKGRCDCMVAKVKASALQKIYDYYEHGHKRTGNNILLMSETKPYLWGNLKYIDERIKERDLDKDFNVAYTFRIAVGKNNSTRSWIDTVKLIATQDYIFVDDYAPIFGTINLSPQTKLIQVWHAGEGFKAIGYSRFGMAGSPHPYSNSHREYDYVITGSKRLVEVYSEAFGLPEDKVLPLGMARMDGFLDKDIIAEKTENFYNEHPECRGRKLILFCPTFRGSNQKNARYPYDKLDFDSIYDFCGTEYIWAFKMHPFVHNHVSIPDDYKNRIIDLTENHDINDLYYVTDIMITDYSSAYYEYSILKRPVLFYTYDRAIYELTRGVHKSVLDTAPGKVCDTFDELMDALKNKDFEIEKTIRFSEENFDDSDGKASDRIIDTILLKQPSPEER